MKYAFFLLLMSFPVILWVWAIVDINKCQFKRSYYKFLSFLLVLTVPILGPIIYFQCKKRFSIAKRRVFMSGNNTSLN